jgi:hypothetical protein
MWAIKFCFLLIEFVTVTVTVTVTATVTVNEQNAAQKIIACG